MEINICPELTKGRQRWSLLQLLLSYWVKLISNEGDLAVVNIAWNSDKQIQIPHDDDSDCSIQDDWDIIQLCLDQLRQVCGNRNGMKYHSAKLHTSEPT